MLSVSPASSSRHWNPIFSLFFLNKSHRRFFFNWNFSGFTATSHDLFSLFILHFAIADLHKQRAVWLRLSFSLAANIVHKFCKPKNYKELNLIGRLWIRFCKLSNCQIGRGSLSACLPLCGGHACRDIRNLKQFFRQTRILKLQKYSSFLFVFYEFLTHRPSRTYLIKFWIRFYY